MEPKNNTKIALEIAKAKVIEFEGWGSSDFDVRAMDDGNRYIIALVPVGGRGTGLIRKVDPTTGDVYDDLDKKIYNITEMNNQK